MKRSSLVWSPAEDLKLIKGLKDGYSLPALSSIIGHPDRAIQQRCIDLDLYRPVRENASDTSAITLKVKTSVKVSSKDPTSGITFKALLDNGWTAHCINGEDVLFSPEWWRTRKDVPLIQEDEETELGAKKSSLLLNHGKPWTPDDTRVLLHSLQPGISKSGIIELMMRSYQSIIQQLLDLGMIVIGAEDNASEEVIWLNKKIHSSKLTKRRFLDVLPLIESGWTIDGFELKAPAWWTKHKTLDDLVYLTPYTQVIAGENKKPDETGDLEPKVNDPKLNHPNQKEPVTSKPAKWMRGNYKYLITLLSEHRPPEVIARKMNRTVGAICSRIQHIGLSRYEKASNQGEKGNVHKVTEILSDHFRSQPQFVKQLLLEAGWKEESNVLHCPVWWINYPHNV